MKINSARQAWHDCNYNPAPGQTSDVAELGVVVQKTERGPTANLAIHGALAGHIQSAIARLHSQLRAFGNAMYAAEPTDDDREEAEEAVFNLACSWVERMTASKRHRASYVAKGVFRRYRYMHQGGQSASVDPLIKPEVFRAWLDGEYNIKLASVAWGRDWEPFVQLCFNACHDIDARALSPIGNVIYKMKEAA
ncbi:hypothetical protein NYP20_12045 [Pseudomonas sp. N3-W]|jgi:hypothetical protein|uniref:Uncharacterized protein n=1 Tax=Pseudomonas fungipugnans TaxID=3024217 RepID=A0ABT6QYP5_9PSED|nr:MULTISPECIES: hypothetical protein [unclassified Pseudomonas]MDI2595367.1 hypothetical protein [Pseudomonas sp. 681]UWF51649.1 hypothetical protein NYP20_12045 [Pseudomonas sp. N3-W]